MTFLKWFLSSPRRAGGSSKGDWSPFEAAPPEAGKSVSAETLAALSGCGLLPENGVWGHAPPGAFGRATASPQTRQMRCWLSSERTTNPSSRRKRQDSLSLSLVLFPPKSLRWVSAGALLWAVIKTPVLYFLHFCVGGITYPPVAVAVSEQPGAGFISAEKTAFSEWVLCADGHAVPSCTQRFFGIPTWGWDHYPRRALHAVETLDARGSRRRIRRFYAAAEFALCGLNLPSAGTHATPSPKRAHSGSHAETRGGFPARDIGRVDRVNSLGTLCIVTFGTA